MADLAASDVSYSIVNKDVTDSGHRDNIVDVTFGDGAKTYPSGGVPLTNSSLGLPNTLLSLHMIEDAAGNGLVYKYDISANKIRIYEGDYAQGGDAELAELDSGSDAPSAATLRIRVKGW